MRDLKALIRDVPGFPSADILFRDITPLLRTPEALAEAVERLGSPYADAGIDLVAGIEARGFLFGTPLALALGAGFVPIRKLGKLPGETVGREYALEYGTNHLEVHADAIGPGQRVLLVDDVLATGGTARASVELVRQLGGEVVAAAFLIELRALKGRAALVGTPVHALVEY